MEPSIQSQFIQFSNKHLPRYSNYRLVNKILRRILCIDELLKLKDKYKDIGNFDLVNTIIDSVGLSAKYENLEKIPSHGRLLVVANHPMGGADWLLILQCLSTIRQDIKVVINKDVYTLIENMRDLYIPVDQYATFNDEARKQIAESLEREEAVLIFPSGGISIFTHKGIRDRKWKNGVIHFSRDHQTDVLPVFIGGRFSLAFYLYPIVLRRLLLVRNLLHPPSKNIKVRIGDIISYKELLKGHDLSNISSQLRTVVYRLGVPS
jgi:putative hemolysin